MAEPIRYCVTVDTEEEWDWDSGYPTQSARVENIQKLPAFQAMCESAGAAVVYFTNHAVLANPASRQVMQELARRPKTEVGLHIHPWCTPPLANVPMVPTRESFLHNLPWDIGRAKLESVLDQFAQAGIKPTSYRGGRYSTSDQMQQFLRERGLWVDCSVLPFNTWKDDGAPDHRQREIDPVRREHAGQPVWELPLSFGTTRTPFRFWINVLNSAQSKIGRMMKITGILDRLGVVSRAWLNFENPHAGDVLRFLGVLRSMRLPLVSFTLHSSSLLVGGSPYSKTEADVTRIMTLAESVLKTVAAWPDFAPATMTEIAQHLESQHARARHQSAG